jgi:hypothetical protein
MIGWMMDAIRDDDGEDDGKYFSTADHASNPTGLRTDWIGGERGGNTEGAPKKRFWFEESFLYFGIVSLQWMNIPN